MKIKKRRKEEKKGRRRYFPFPDWRFPIYFPCFLTSRRSQYLNASRVFFFSSPFPPPAVPMLCWERVGVKYTVAVRNALSLDSAWVGLVTPWRMYLRDSYPPLPLPRESWKNWPPLRGLPTDPTPRTTLRTSPRTTLRTTLTNQPNLLSRRKELEEAYLPTRSHLINSRHLDFRHFTRPSSPLASPQSSSATSQSTPFSNGWPVIVCWIFIPFNLFQLFAWENARGDRPHIYTGVKPCVNLLYFSSNEHVL